jgi:hypothetical protein
MPLAETAGRNGDPDADRESPFGHRDHLTRVPGISRSLFVLQEPADSRQIKTLLVPFPSAGMT